MATSIAVMRRALDEAHRSGVGIAMLRDKPLNPEEITTGDYDYIAPGPEAVRFCTLLLREAREHGLMLRISHKKPGKTLIVLGEGEEQLAIEIWSRIEVGRGTLGALDFVDAAGVLAKHTCAGETGPELEPTVGALLYLTHLNHKDKDTDSAEVQRRLQQYLERLDDTGARARQLVEEARSGRVGEEHHQAALQALRGAGVAVEREWAHRLHKSRHRNAVKRRAGRPVLVFAGPDGVGKTTLMERFLATSRNTRLQRFKRLYRGWLPIKLAVAYQKKRWGRQKNTAEESMPGLANMLALLSYWRLLLLSSRRRLWLMDRFFPEYALRGLRIAIPFKCSPLGRLATRLAPAPRGLVLVHCPEAIRQARKPDELRTESAEWLYAEYIEYIFRSRVETIGCPSNNHQESERTLGVIRDHFGPSPNNAP